MGAQTAYGPGETWPSRVDTYLAAGVEAEHVQQWVQSASILHSNGDALVIAVKDGKIVGVRAELLTGSTTGGWVQRICLVGRPTPPRTGFVGR